MEVEFQDVCDDLKCAGEEKGLISFAPLLPSSLAPREPARKDRNLLHLLDRLRAFAFE